MPTVLETPVTATLNEQVRAFLAVRFRPMLIDGQWVASASGRTFRTYDPAEKAAIAEVAEGDREDVARAVAAARRAFDRGAWPRQDPAARQRVLLKVADLLEAHLEELAQLETLNQGKALAETRNIDLPIAAEVFRYYAGFATKIYGETNPSDGDHLVFTLREPVGVVGAIIPWNFPLVMAAMKLAPALAAGNTVVLKPAEQTPLTALRLGELLLEAGVPPGVVNIVPGMGETAGAALVESPGVDKIAFTGSTEVGRAVQRAAAGSLKRVSLELGGKSPNIVFADADLDAAAEGATIGAFLNQGQVCCAGTRLFLEKKIHDAFLAKLEAAASGIAAAQGPGLAKTTGIGGGPLVSAEQHERVARYLEVGRREGAEVVCGGDVHRDGALARGWFVKPTIFTGVSNRMRIAREEIFGPVVSVIPFGELDEVIAAGNDTEYGLAAGIFTRDGSKAIRAARALRAGTIWINTFGRFDVGAPFGGFKASGMGRELGRHALDLYTEVKAVHMRV